MRLKSKRLTRTTSSLLIFIVLLIGGIYCSNASNNSFGVKPNDSWVFIVKKARRHFEYSLGYYQFSSSTEGFRLGDDLVPLQEKIDVRILSNESITPETIQYQINWGNTSVISKSSSIHFEEGIQESLGQGVFGTGYDFLLGDSGVSIGNWVFIVPINLLLSSPMQIWNQSTLSGAIEGMETVLELDDSDNERDYHMWIRYAGNMTNFEEEIDLQFNYYASFRWEKITGVLLTYEITAYMEGSYKQSIDSHFALDLKLDRSDLDEIIGKRTPGFDPIILLLGLAMIVASRIYSKKI
ncbi:MAG: hypothetical protein ACXADY_08620 [Candidatus Hodarchaeales archaeon]|jgi:hypothetical protein